MKFQIVSANKKGPWGGGNQFLKAIKKELKNLGFYSESLKDADVLIFNSYQDIPCLVKYFFLYHKKKRLHRLGPIMSLHREGLRWKIIDKLVVLCANIFVDIVVFQSEWSLYEARKQGFWAWKKYSVIVNAPDTSIFWKKEFKEKQQGEKTRLIYTTWSSNMKKGFRYLKFLDENLDFSKYEFTFIGNSPFTFRNIKMIEAIPSGELAPLLREHDIFVSPVEDDACSNSLLEALSSGLPVVALKSGGNPEIIKEAGVLFENNQELLEGIDAVAGSLKNYYDLIRVKTIHEIAEEYKLAVKNI